MNTRDRIVDAARELFWQQGYHSTSVQSVLARADAGSGSLYHFFGGKDDLLKAVLRRYLELLDEWIVRPAFERTEDPVERIFLILDGYRTGLVQSHFRFACPIGRLALEMSGGSDEIRDLIALNFDQWADRIAQSLTDAGDRFPRDMDRHALSRFVLTTMEGAVMQSDTARSIEPFDACISQLRSYFALLEATADAVASPDN
jgi:AcrR family transcriptional regulator